MFLPTTLAAQSARYCLFSEIQSLKVVDGVECPTFHAGCLAMGLLEDDVHWDDTLREAAVSDSPKKLRELFVIMLVF
ncbi:hypothetical protein M8J76_007327 [Diaphorina citri]|nr:hypothetical protein M8J76_007327 [Diaphorina citri]